MQVTAVKMVLMGTQNGYLASGLTAGAAPVADV